MKEIVLSIDGQIIMTPALSKAIDNVFDGRVPYDWMYDTTGAEISWLYPGLGAWFTSLNRRNSQLSRWVSNVRPPDFWMTGFFNPQGFLTSMKQEVTRMNKTKGRGGGYGGGGGADALLALDDVTLVSEVQDKYDVLKLNNPKQEGVYIRELFLEAARWTKGSLDEPEEKQMYAPFPLLYMSAEKKKKGQGDMEKPQKFYCPIYKYKKRTDLYLITRVWLNCDGNSGGSKHWKLRGVALLCTKEA